MRAERARSAITRLTGREGFMFSLASVVGKCERRTFSLPGRIVASYFHLLDEPTHTRIPQASPGLQVQRAGMEGSLSGRDPDGAPAAVQRQAFFGLGLPKRPFPSRRSRPSNKGIESTE